jgi:hypothetical protein
MQVPFGNAVVAGHRARAQACLVAAVADRAADPGEKLFCAARGLGLRTRGECRESTSAVDQRSGGLLESCGHV